MPIGQLCGGEDLDDISIRLQEAMQRVCRNMEQLRKNARTAETNFADWQKQWARRQTDLSRRMEFIEAELQRLTDQTPGRPRLGVCGVPADGQEMTSMRPF